MFDITSNKQYYYDSIKNYRSSFETAKRVGQKLTKYFQLPTVPDLSIIHGPVQHNSFDCGVYMLHAIDHILMNFANKTFFQHIVIPLLSELDCIQKRCFTAYIIANGHITTKEVIISLLKTNTVEKTDDYLEGSMNSTYNVPQYNEVKRPTPPLVDTAVQTELSSQVSKSSHVQYTNTASLKAVQRSAGGVGSIVELENCVSKQEAAIFTNITILSDSHGRGLAGLLQDGLGYKYKVNEVVRPGATLSQVIWSWCLELGR